VRTCFLGHRAQVKVSVVSIESDSDKLRCRDHFIGYPMQYRPHAGLINQWPNPEARYGAGGVEGRRGPVVTIGRWLPATLTRPPREGDPGRTPLQAARSSSKRSQWLGKAHLHMSSQLRGSVSS
jgi:hypothetical protein